MQKLTEAEIARDLRGLPEWERQGNGIARVFDRKTFQGALAFVTTLAEIAERANHHPDIDIRYSKVRVFLTTHDAGGLTLNDVAMARQITAAAS
jgi:4a-hydroxytetrahydrobiopterin dehydratase